MKRFLVFALFGALSVAGGTGLAFGQQVRPQAKSAPQATKPSSPAAPGKLPPSKSPTHVKKSAPQAQRPTAQASKSPTHVKKSAPQAQRSPAKGGKSSTQAKQSAPQAHRPPAKKSKSPSQAHKGPTKPGKGPQNGAGSYSWNDYKRDLDKGSQELRDGNMEELPGELQVAGGAIAGIPAGPPGIVGGALGAAGKNLPQLIEGKEKEVKGEWDGISATGKFIGARLNDISKSNPRPTKPQFGMGK